MDANKIYLAGDTEALILRKDGTIYMKTKKKEYYFLHRKTN